MTVSDDDVPRAGHFRDLRWSLRGLALAGADQPTLFADHPVNADDLATGYDRALSVVRENYDGDLLPIQLDALAAIHRKLATMSRDGAEFDLDLWTDAALRTSEHWAEIRTLARTALEAFEWVVEDASESSSERGSLSAQ
jgi:hypothetical protein